MRISPGRTGYRRSRNSKLALQSLALSQIAAIDELPDAQPKVDFDWPHPRIARIHG